MAGTGECLELAREPDLDLSSGVRVREDSLLREDDLLLSLAEFPSGPGDCTSLGEAYGLA